MMQKDQAEYIESHYDVMAIQVNGHPIWVYLRMVYHAYFQRISIHYPQTKSGRLRSLPKTLAQLKSSFYGDIRQIFKKRQYLVFSDAAVRKSVNGKYVDKQFEFIMQTLGYDNVLCVEALTAVQPVHFPREKVPTKHIMSYSLFLLLSLVFWIKPMRLKGNDVLNKFKKDFNITLNHWYFFKNFLAQYDVMSLWVKWQRPKAIFVNSYYGKMPIIKAAKELNIPVIELQHGMIEHDDIAYFARRPDIDTSYFPDYFLSFGEKEKKFFKVNRYPLIPYENVYPVGSYLIDLSKKTFKLNAIILEKKASYKTVICVSGQDENEESIIAFLKQASELDSSLLFLYVPRTFYKDEVEKVYDVPTSIHIVKNMTVYDAILHADIHSSVHSTCAIEALSLGVKNILINIDGIAFQFFDKQLPDRTLTQFADTPEEYVQKIQSFQPELSRVVSEKNNCNITSGFSTNIQAFLQLLLAK